VNASIVIMIVGIVLGSCVGGLIMASAGGLSGGPTLARVGKGGVVVLATFMALQELGVATEIVTTAFAILFGAVALALSLAFGLGARELAGEVTRDWYRRYREERDSIERDNLELDKVEGIATTEEYVRPTYVGGIRHSGPHDVFRPPKPE
jgi:predicted alpha/beta hydrolase